MQTFLPFPDFQKSAACLDNKRLGKQRVEVLTLLRGKYKNHPASKMWVGYEYQLAKYGMAICLEWRNRGFKDTVLEKIQEFNFSDTGFPPWFGNPDFHLRHQSRLIQKDPTFYQPLFPDAPDNLPYRWK